MRRRVAAASGVVAALVATCSGCGLPGRVDVQRIPASQVPFALLDADRTAQPLPAAGPATLIYFVADGRLVAAHRHVSAANVAAQAVRLVLDGPTPDEAAHGLTTDIPAQTRMISLDVSGRVATVDLSSAFGAIGGSDQVLGVAQIVWTVTALPQVNAVLFSINGRHIEVPDGSGSLGAAPRHRGDYPRQAPLPR